MQRERWVQLAAAGIALLALTLSILLLPTLNEQRSDIRPNIAQSGLPADYAIASTALGPFRGLLVDWWWYRAEMLKQAGKYYEANTLANWITTLQPRFPRVWRFHAWNMAYNISVATHTPEERWSWVQKGIRLLRNEGIPYNPKTLGIYRELGWIFFHKVGGVSDDHHWYYKRKLAGRWQSLLGQISENATQEEALKRFRPILEASEAYFTFDQPTRETRQRLSELSDQFPEHADQFDRLAELPTAEGRDRLAKWLKQWRNQQLHELVEEAEPLLATFRQRVKRANRSPVAVLRDQYPETGAILQALGQHDVELDGAGLERLGRVLMKIDHVTLQHLKDNDELLEEHERPLLSIIEEHRGSEAWDQLLAFWRARVLTRDYNMEPAFMYDLMERFGPMDWRHPCAHSLYWSAMGVERAINIGGSGQISSLNTDRRVVHSLQKLMHKGRVSFNPIFEEIDYLPDPRFIESYEAARLAARDRASESGARQRVLETFDRGHRFFLEKAVVYAYLYGDRDQARHYYEKIQELYNEDGTDETYNLPLSDMVTVLVQRDVGDREEGTRAFVEAMLRQGVARGLAEGDRQTFGHFLETARSAHEQYQALQQKKPNIPAIDRHRMMLPPFDRMVVQAYSRYMNSSDVPLLKRARVYHNSPMSLRERAYPNIRERLAQEVEQHQYSMAEVFPEPDNMDAFRASDDGNPLPKILQRQ